MSIHECPATIKNRLFTPEEIATGAAHPEAKKCQKDCVIVDGHLFERSYSRFYHHSPYCKSHNVSPCATMDGRFVNLSQQEVDATAHDPQVVQRNETNRKQFVFWEGHLYCVSLGLVSNEYRHEPIRCPHQSSQPSNPGQSTPSQPPHCLPAPRAIQPQRKPSAFHPLSSVDPNTVLTPSLPQHKPLPLDQILTTGRTPMPQLDLPALTAASSIPPQPPVIEPKIGTLSNSPIELGRMGDIDRTLLIRPNRSHRCGQIAVAIAALALLIIGILGVTGILSMPLAASGSLMAVGASFLIFSAGYEAYHRRIT